MWTTLMQSSDLFSALIVTLFQQNMQFGATFNYMQWTSEKKSIRGTYIKPDNLSLTSWIFRYQVHEWTKTLQKFGKIRLWIDLCPRGNLQSHKYNNLDKETCPDICIHFFELCGGTKFLLQFWSSSPRCIFHWSSWKFSFPMQCENGKLFPDIETTIKIKLGRILEKLTQKHNRRESARFDMSQDDCDNEIFASTQFLQI